MTLEELFKSVTTLNEDLEELVLDIVESDAETDLLVPAQKLLLASDELRYEVSKNIGTENEEDSNVSVLQPQFEKEFNKIRELADTMKLELSGL